MTDVAPNAAPFQKQKKKSELTGTAVKARYFTPAEAYIPPLGGSRVAHFPIPINRSAAPHSAAANAAAAAAASYSHSQTSSSNNNNNSYGNNSNNKTELDGFLVLEAAGLGFPEEVECANLSDRKLTSVVEDDLTYFSELLYADVSENRLPFLAFGAFPKLRELRMACNFISVIEDDIYGFNQLMFLDLSYNQLSVDSIHALSSIPLLKELDLSGNNLKSLPPDFSRFQSLDKLVLQYNKLDNNDLFISLTSISSLRSLDVSHNYFSKFPEECHKYGNFSFLDTLNISFNYFAREEHIEPLIHLPRLLTVMLYGNPVLGPTGEDPMFIYIEDILEQAHNVRDAAKSSIPDIEFITEVPRRRILKKGQPLGRLALYRDFSMVQVEGNVSTKSNQEWRKQGTQTIFAEAIANQKRHQQSLQVSNSGAALPDFTFITNSMAPSNQNGRANVGINYADTDATADEVMTKVANEMGLLNPVDIQILQQYAHLPPSALAAELERSINKPAIERSDDFMQGFDSPIAATPVHHPHEGFDFPQDRVPSHLFSATIAQQGVPATIAGQPIALKTAMKALQRAIEQPLTDYDEVPAKWSNNSNDYLRPTSLSQLRQMPRIVRPMPQVENEADNILDSSSKKYGAKGLTESDAYKHVRSQNREKTLHQIDEVLQRLNENTNKVTNADVGREVTPSYPTITTTTTINTTIVEDEGEVLNANAFSNPFSSAGLVDYSKFHVNVQKAQTTQASTSNMKQSMDRMRYFARPAGVKQLMNMVDEIVDEFNS